MSNSLATNNRLDEPITVVIPAHNEEKTIAHVVEGVCGHIPALFPERLRFLADDAATPPHRS